MSNLFFILLEISVFFHRLPGVLWRSFKHEIRELYCALRNEVIRTLILVGIGMYFLKPDNATKAMIDYSFGMSILLVAAAHLTIKVVFRSIRITDLVTDAKEKRNSASAIVVLAYCLVLIALMHFFAVPLMR